MMKMRNQNDIERVKDHLQQGKITVAQANVQMVLNERVKVVTHLPKGVRSALNEAVKSGELGHMKKKNGKPEVYFHPNFKYMAVEARNAAIRRKTMALLSVCTSESREATE